MNPSSTGGAPGTTTLNDYRIRGFVPEDASSGPSTTALVLASALVVAVLAVDAYVFFGPSRSDSGSAAPAAPVTAPRADVAPAAPPPAAPATPAMSSPVGTQPSLARVETKTETAREAAQPARHSAPAKAAAPKSSPVVASSKSAAVPKTSTRTDTATSPAADTPTPRAPAAHPATPGAPDGTPSASAPSPIVVPAEPMAAAPREPATSAN